MTALEESNGNPLENLLVGNLGKDLPLIVEYFTKRADCFKSGQLTHKLCAWRKIHNSAFANPPNRLNKSSLPNVFTRILFKETVTDNDN